MAKPPDMIAYIVEDRGEGVKANWKEVAAVWNHRNGPGMDLIIPQGMALSGRLVIMPRKEREEQPTQPQQGQQRTAGRSGPAPRG